MNVNNEILDLRYQSNHPLSFLYSEIYSSCLLDAEIKYGRSQPGFALDQNSPFVIAARVANNKSNCIKSIQNIFNLYYSCFEPKNAMEFLGFKDLKNPVLKNKPPWGSVFPWRYRSVESYQNAYETMALIENKAVGINNGIEDGWLFCGPCTQNKSLVEAKRIAYVVEQIKQFGYLRSDDSDGDVKATALINEKKEWRWLITGGNHRASGASAVGYKTIPIRVNLVIDRNHVSYWPHVLDGTYTVEEALSFFDRIFNAEVSEGIKSWNKNLINTLSIR